MAAQRIFWITIIIAVMIWEGVGLYYLWVIRSQGLPSSQPLPSLDFTLDIPSQACFPEIQVDGARWSVQHPAVTDVNFRLEGDLKEIQPDKMELIKDGEAITVLFGEGVKFYLRDQNGQYRQIEVGEVQTGQTLEISLSRTSDNKFQVSTITISE